MPKERFIAFTQVPGREGRDTLYGWAGWTPAQRFLALMAIDERLEDEGYGVADRIAVLDSAWRLLPDIEREDPAKAAEYRAEITYSTGPAGPSPELLARWKAEHA